MTLSGVLDLKTGCSLNFPAETSSVASSTDQRRDLKFMLRPASSSFGVATLDSSLNVPSVSATFPLSQRLSLSALVFLVATSLSCRDFTSQLRLQFCY